MKYFAPLFVCLIFISCAHTKKAKKNDLETLHYKGKVKAVAYNICRALEKDGKIVPGSVMSKLQTNCNPAGYFVEQSNFKGDKLNYRIVHIYDSTNTLTEEIHVQQAVVFLSQGNVKPDSMSESHINYTYKTDDKGNKIETKTTKDGKPQYKDEKVFDARGNVIQSTEYAPFDTLRNKIYYKYDNNDNLVERKGYLPNGKMFFKDTYQYDPAGNLAEMVSFKEDSTLQAKEEMKYDLNGNKISDTRILADGSKSFDWRFEFTEFDKEGNWIKEISYNNNKPQDITERVIEYYK